MQRIIESALLLALGFLPVSKTVAEIGVSTSLSLWLLRKLWRRERLLTLPFFNKVYPLFLGVLFLSLIQVPREAIEIGCRGVLKWVEYLALFFLAAELFEDPSSRRRLLIVFFLSMTVISLNGFYQLWSGTDLLRHRALDPGRIIRMKSSLGSPNALAAFFLFALPLAFTAWLKGCREKRRRIILFSPCLLFFSAFILTFSRAAFLALGLGVLIQLLALRKWKALGFFLAGLAGVLFISKDLYWNYIGSLNLQDITIRERLDTWAVTWKMIQVHPFLGNGVNMYYYKLPFFTSGTETHRGYAHNSYLQMWSEVGLLGLLLFLSPFIVAFYSSLKKRLTNPDPYFEYALRVGILAFLIQAFFDNNFYGLETSVLFWLFWGVHAGFIKK